MMLSPLRYPGGKAKLFSYFVEVFRENQLYGCTYVEPYAGGAGLALKLLAHGYVSQIELNDIDPAIASFWRSVLTDTDAMCALIQGAELSVDEWRRQRAVYAEGQNAGDLSLGFAAYYLNRTSRSGIIEGSGPIGGYNQESAWKIDARFNKVAQVGQICEIARFSNCIKISQRDALSFLNKKLGLHEVFVYLDPPYYVKGRKLYKNFYCHKDHENISRLLSVKRHTDWIVSYDYVPEIVDIYNSFEPIVYNLQYSAGAIGTGQEVIFAGDRIRLPLKDGFRRAA